MKRVLSLILALAFACLALCGCVFGDDMSYISRQLNADLTDAKLVRYEDSHGGFLGDGETVAILDMSRASEKFLDRVEGWNPLPLSENLQLLLYGGRRDIKSYDGFAFLKEKGIPEVVNGFWYFRNRQEDIDWRNDDIFDAYSFNFTVAIYNKDTATLYFYEIDT